jgi:small subunit ribosomal protein S3
MGVQITISGKLRGDRSAFEKHTAGILPRAGHHADVIVAEDVAHVKTPMGLIGVRIRIARKEKVIPEFELKKDKSEKETPEQVKVEETTGEDKPKSESEQIIIEAEKMKELETLEEEEEKMK